MKLFHVPNVKEDRFKNQWPIKLKYVTNHVKSNGRIWIRYKVEYRHIRVNRKG